MCTAIDPVLKYSCNGGSCVVNASGTYLTASCDNMCSSTPPVCGNNKLESPEECDDGNKSGGDGCTSDCKKETVPNLCGNSKVDAGEECDDGNYINNDGCSSTCKRDAHMAGGSY